MNVVILTSGPRGAGKSTYCRAVHVQDSEIKLVSRDDLLMRIYGKTSFSPYTESSWEIFEILYKEIKRFFRERKRGKRKNSIVIFDCWNGWPSERKEISRRLRTFGVHKIVCWKFITPIDICEFWYKEREGDTWFSGRGYRLYHKTSKNIENDGFDIVYEINPTQLSFPGFPYVAL